MDRVTSPIREKESRQTELPAAASQPAATQDVDYRVDIAAVALSASASMPSSR
jgi:hypothetical protein